MTPIEKERAIRLLVKAYVTSYAKDFASRHISEVNNPEGVINMKIHNVFISALGPEIQYYSALSRSLDSSLGNMLEEMAIGIAGLSYDVHTHVEGVIYIRQTDFIAELLESYKNKYSRRKPNISDYKGKIHILADNQPSKARHESDYCLYDRDTGQYFLIELKIGGDLDNKKARSEKEALLEQYCTLSNRVGEEKVSIMFATAYNRYGEGRPWLQGRVRQYFAEEELCISRDFWNFICKMDNGFDIVIDEYRKNACDIVKALAQVRSCYLDGDDE